VDLVRADNHDGEAGPEEGVDDLAVAAFDRDLHDAGAVQPAHELTQPGAGGSTRNCSVIVPRSLTMATA
jgi:hypothetical protein